MSNFERRITDRASYEEVLDEQADKLGSYDEARRAINLPQFEEEEGLGSGQEGTPEPQLHRPGRAMGTTAVLSSGERRARQAAAHGPQYGEEARVGFDDGVLPEERPVGEVLSLRDDPERRRIYADGRAKVDAQMGWTPKNETQQ